MRKRYLIYGLYGLGVLLVSGIILKKINSKEKDLSDLGLDKCEFCEYKDLDFDFRSWRDLNIEL